MAVLPALRNDQGVSHRSVHHSMRAMVETPQGVVPAYVTLTPVAEPVAASPISVSYTHETAPSAVSSAYSIDYGFFLRLALALMLFVAGIIGLFDAAMRWGGSGAGYLGLVILLGAGNWFAAAIGWRWMLVAVGLQAGLWMAGSLL